MRFEQMPHAAKIKTMHRLHRFINKEFFDNKLQEIYLTIENLNKNNDDVWAGFSRNAYLFNPETKTAYQSMKIAFAWEFEEYLAEQKTQKMQALIMGHIMLHEMIHQYCYESGLDDSNHGGDWEQAAEEHLLHSIYRDGQCVEEKLSTSAEILFYNFFRL